MGGSARMRFGRGVVALAVLVGVGFLGVGPASGMSGDASADNDSISETPGAVRSDGERPAVARCKDGSVSANTDFRTTCKTRGGIDHWAVPFGKCVDGTVFKFSRRASCHSHDGFKVLLAKDFVPKARKGHIAGCQDGTFTAEKRFAKTCSNRGGVRRWLKTYGSCADGHAIRMSTKSTCKGHGGFKALLPSEEVPAEFGDNVALCNDGGYSNEVHFSDTCSGKDGIKVWLANYGLCDGGAVIKMRMDSSCVIREFDRLLPGDYKPIEHGFVALCMSGAYSANVEFKGTCESSGGVRSWLATYGKCADQAVFRVDRDASCDGHAGYRGLLAPGYVPKARVPSNLATTTTSPPTTAPPTTAPPATTEPYVPPTSAPSSGSGCDPNYSGCVPISSDVDCLGGSGNGPEYVAGPVTVIGSDIYGLDGDGDGQGCNG